jgi:hypothetical protein
MEKRDDTERDEKRREEERRDEEEYREEARYAQPVTPEYQGEHLIFDDLRNEPTTPADAEREREEMGPLAAPVEEPGTKDELLGEGVGGASGAVVGAAVGSLAGPLGAAVGAIAGALGGWWAGRAVVDVASGITPEDDQAYREDFERTDPRMADRAYEDVRYAYHLGHIARWNPEYEGRSFEEIEGDLARAWTEDLRGRHGDWIVVRHFVRVGYLRTALPEPARGAPLSVPVTRDHARGEEQGGEATTSS